MALGSLSRAMGGGFGPSNRGGNLGTGMSLINGQMVRAQAPPEYTPQAAYPRAIEQQAGDYDDIMSRYRRNYDQPDQDYGDLMNRYRQQMNTMQQGPAQATYAETPQFQEAFGSARNLASTGGISAQEEADMRSRGVSPLRSAYANASRNMERQARLGGGRSANYNAAASRMAREQGELMAQGVTNVNAGIAEQRQRGRIAGTGNMTTMGEGSSTRRNEVEMANALARNRHGETTASMLGGMGNLIEANQNRRQRAVEGMTSLYGTTPALVNTFGNQVQNAQQMAANNPRTRRPGAAGVGGISMGGFGGFNRVGY
jgi:hypothetical protein